MIVSFIFVGLSLLAACSFLLVIRYGAPGICSEKELDSRLLPVDLPSVANLYDPVQIAYVRSRLTRTEFVAFERERGKVLAEYVKRFFRNSGLLVGYAHHVSDKEGSQLRSELLNQALRLRIESMKVLGLLYLKICFPQVSVEFERLVFTYRLAVTTARDSDSLVS